MQIAFDNMLFECTLRGVYGNKLFSNLLFVNLFYANLLYVNLLHVILLDVNGICGQLFGNLLYIHFSALCRIGLRPSSAKLRCYPAGLFGVR